MRSGVCMLAALLSLVSGGTLAQSTPVLRPSLESSADTRPFVPVPVHSQPIASVQPAQGEGSPPLRSINDSGQPTYRVMRIESSEAPVIDGNISEAVWAKAPAITDLKQSDPSPGAPATERTEMRILYDRTNLYISIYAYDSAPDQIVMASMARDTKPGTGDFVRIFLDPFKTRRNAYVFDIAPSGGRLEALTQNKTDLIETWNTIWDVRTRVVEDGWVAEMAIPFRSVSYDPDSSEWGFDFFRLIRRKTERTRWGSTNPSLRFVDISQSGVLTGLDGIDEGLGLEAQLFATARYKHDWGATPERGALSGSGSANLFYRITPSLTGTVTVNPDFSDTPLDERQVNTSRFSLFLPETRDFFLQDASAFEFGGFAFSAAQNARPFFSRNIGLVNGLPVSIIGGGKVSGNIGPLEVGALSVMTNQKDGTPRQVLSAARAVAPLSDTIYFGVIGTNGDPTGLTRNSVAGADLRFFDPSFANNMALQMDAYYERSFSDVLGQGASFGGAVHFPNEPWKASLRAKQVDQNFTPALGFVNRQGIREYFGEIFYRMRFRNFFLRWLDLTTYQIAVTDLDNKLQSRENAAGVVAYTEDSDLIEVTARSYGENVTTAFNLPGGVQVPAGNYNWVNGNLHIESAVGRSYSLIADVLCCNFYDGNYLRADMAFSFRIGDYLEIGPRYVGTFIRLPTGDVDIHVLSSNLNVNFTPDMQLALQAQFDNISRNFGGAIRYRWEYAPGDEFFAAFVQSGLIPGTTFRPQVSQFSLRLGHTLRY